jgi:hypothetical protein
VRDDDGTIVHPETSFVVLRQPVRVVEIEARGAKGHAKVVARVIERGAGVGQDAGDEADQQEAWRACRTVVTWLAEESQQPERKGPERQHDRRVLARYADERGGCTPREGAG